MAACVASILVPAIVHFLMLAILSGFEMIYPILTPASPYILEKVLDTMML